MTPSRTHGIACCNQVVTHRSIFGTQQSHCVPTALHPHFLAQCKARPRCQKTEGTSLETLSLKRHACSRTKIVACPDRPIECAHGQSWQRTRNPETEQTRLLPSSHLHLSDHHLPFSTRLVVLQGKLRWSRNKYSVAQPALSETGGL
jgi:hypothetical protein